MAANNSLIVQVRRGTTAQTASYTGPLAELIVDTDQKLISVQDGVTAGGNYLAPLSFAQAAYNTANSAGAGAGVLAQSAFDKANSANVLAQSAYNFSNTVNVFTQSSYIQANASIITAQAGFSKANSANVLAQSAFNQANTANITGQAAFDNANSKLSILGGTISGSVTIQQNLTVNGNVSYTGNVTSVTVTGNTGQFFGYSSNGFNALYAGIPTGYLIEPQMITQFTANYDGYAGVNHQNINSGANSSSDIFLTADNGTAIEGYVDLGIGSSTYNYPGYSLIKPNDGYFYVAGNTTTGGGNVIIATYLTNDIIFATNGLETTNEVLRITAANTVLIKSSIATNNTTSGALRVAGGIGIQGDVQASNVYSQSINLLNYSNTIYNFANTVNIYSYSSNVFLQNSISSTNTAMKSYVDQANTGMASYVVASNTAMKAYVDQANTGLKSYTDLIKANVSGYTANVIFFSNTTGYISNTVLLSYYTSNNTLVTTNANVSTSLFVAYGKSQGLVDISKIALAQSFIV